MDETAFAYESLPSPSHIRLLERLPPASDGSLRFRLVTTDLDTESVLSYYCLSYTWGNPFAHGLGFSEAFDAADPEYDESNKIRILIDGKALDIQRNLHDALSTIPDDTFKQFVSRPLDNTKGHRYLHRAAALGKATLLRLWLARGTDINITDDEGYTALHYAAGNNQLETTRILIRYGCVVDIQNDAGKTALDCAVDEGYDEVAALLRGHQDVEKCEIELQLVYPYIWADAICINQSCIEEKSAQVSVMDRIYSSAAFVVGWLGPPDAFSERGIKALKTLKKYSRAFSDSEIIPFGGKSSEKYEAANMPYLHTDDWIALGSLFQRQWFRRAWIIQEAVLNNGFLIYLGTTLIEWRQLGDVAEAIRYQEAKLGTDSSTRFVPSKDVAVSVVRNMAEVAKLRRSKAMAIHPEKVESCRQFFTLKTMAHNFWTFLATDPRDKIFACYGLLNAFAQDRKLADYSLTVPQVYTMACRELIGQEGNLSPLGNCVYPLHRRPDLPSWVPDFGLPGLNAVPDSFTADRKLTYVPPKITQTMQDPELHIKGAFLCRVSRVGGRSGTAGIEKLAFDRSWLTLPLAMRGKGGYGDNTILSSILWTTLCMGKSSGSLFDSTKYGNGADDMQGMEFRYFLNLLILAEADSKIREKLGFAKRTSTQELWFDVSGYDPMTEDPEMEAILADLVAFEEHDGGCWTPTRAEVLKNWYNYTYNVLRVIEVDLEKPPTDIHLPPGISQDSSRAIGNGYVLPSSLPAHKLQGFINAYSILHGGRQLMTFHEDRYLGLGSLTARPGDELWLLPGLYAPALMRAKEEARATGESRRYEFLGACYVHGFMEGDIRIPNELEDITLI